MGDSKKVVNQGKFRNEVEKIINKNSLENESNTPDFILAEYLLGCLQLFDLTVNKREVWYNRKKQG